MSTYTIDDFNKAIKDTVFVNTLSNIITAADYSYQGFKPSRLFELLVKIKTDKNVSDSDFLSDIAKLLTLFHIRGPNTSRIAEGNTTGGKTTATILTNLINKYSVKASVDKKPDIITLPRLSQTFPYLSYLIWGSIVDKGLINMPVSEVEIGLLNSKPCSPNCIPSLLSDLTDNGHGKVFFIYCIYQAVLSHKTEKKIKKGSIRKSDQQHFIAASKYAHLSYLGSFASQEPKSEMDSKLMGVGNTFSTPDMLKMFKKFFSTLPVDSLDAVPTKYHIILNYLILSNKTTDTITEADFNMFYEEVVKKYGTSS